MKGIAEMNVSRRNVLTGMGVAAGAVALAGLTGCSASTSSDETTEESTETGRWSWSVAPDPIDESEISETIDCEILVCGYGSGGVAATTYAAAMGADVVVMTAGSVPEGEGAYCGVYNSPFDADYNIEYDPAYWKRRLTMEGVGAIETPATGLLLDRSGDAINWFAEYVNDRWPYVVSSEETLSGGDGIHDNMTGVTTDHVIYTWPDTTEENATVAVYNGFPQFLAAADEQAQEDGAQVLFSTPLQQLITDESGAVTGAVGMDEDGNYIQVNASLGVLLVTGDIHQDEEMLECFCPEMVGDFTSRNPYGNATGGGHKAALWAGAKLDAGSYMFGFCWPHDFTNEEYPPQAWSIVPYLRVNAAGQRYTNEELGSHEEYSTSPLCLADARQIGGTAYQILDSKYGELLDADAFDTYVEQGLIYKADTLEELAETVGIDYDNLAETVERYNELCELGVDEDCGVDETYLPYTSITDAPFYCMDHPVQKQACNGGVRCNKYRQVYDENREIIPGLYAAGCICSGAAGPHYGWTGFYGSNKMEAMVGGMCAVKHMLGTWDEDFSA